MSQRLREEKEPERVCAHVCDSPDALPASWDGLGLKPMQIRTRVCQAKGDHLCTDGWLYRPCMTPCPSPFLLLI